MSGDASESTSSLRTLADDEPLRHDIFLGLAAPLGSSKKEVLAALKHALTPYGYGVKSVRLSDLLDEIRPKGAQPLPSRGEPNYYELRMNAGDDLRSEAGDDSALAALAIAKIASKREKRRADAAAGSASNPKVYVFDSLKHPRECALLRSTYGSAFWLISLVQDIAERTRNVAAELGEQQGQFGLGPEPLAAELIARDEADANEPHGQHVRDVFSTADFFLPIRRGVKWREELERFVSGVFDAPFLSPSIDEEAMRHAHAAALRSAAIGRQVGAVILPELGTPFVLGTNEVPRPGGGQYREGDVPDHRDFQTGSDPNPVYTERVIKEIFNRLADHRFFTKERSDAGGAAVLAEAMKPGDDGKSVLDGTRAKSLIEFTRCLHAEQAAIVNAARTGVAVNGARLYTTTFPCHECTKFIVGAGIVEVQYVEPYPKSLAGDLYADLIDTVPPMEASPAAAGEGLERVPFRAFLGFGPSRYDEVFSAADRRSGSGIREHVPSEAKPVGRNWSEVAVRTKEAEVGLAITAAVTELRAREADAEPVLGELESEEIASVPPNSESGKNVSA